MSEFDNNEMIEENMSVLDEDYDDQEDTTVEEEEKPLTILGQDEIDAPQETVEDNTEESNDDDAADIERHLLKLLLKHLYSPL
jgi:hypothetical protein